MSYAVLGGGQLAAAAAAGGLAARYVRGRSRVEAATVDEVAHRLADIGEVDSLSIHPLVERLVARPDLRGEPDTVYLLRAGDVSLIFDGGRATDATPPRWRATPKR